MSALTKNGEDMEVTPVDFIHTKGHDEVLAQMLLSHQTADFCLVGGKVLHLSTVILLEQYTTTTRYYEAADLCSFL